MKKIAITISVLLFLTGCQDIENCETNDDLEVMTVRFYDIDSKGAKKVGFLIGSGELTYDDIFSSDSTAIDLPLDPNSKETSFFFISDTSFHTLEMSYEVRVSIFDPSCDPSFTFVNLDTVRQTFDSTVVVGAVTNRQLSTNVEVYF